MTPRSEVEAKLNVAASQPARIVGDLTVFIPTVGRPELDRCLRALAGGTARPARVIVVDQGENPAVAEWLRAAEVAGLATVHIRSAGRSPSSARNEAIAQLDTPFAAAIDDDCVPASDWLECIDHSLRRHPDALITGRCLPAGGGMAPTIVTSQVPRIHTTPSMRFPSPLATGNMGFALATARRLGPLDEKLAEAEDNDWAYRALRAGIPIVYAPEVVVDHVHWRSGEQVVAVARAYARSQGAFYGKHLRRGDWSMVLRTGDYILRNGYVMLRAAAARDRARVGLTWLKLTQLLAGVTAGLRGRGSR